MTDWKAYIRMLKKWLWMVVVITAIFSSAAAYYSMYQIQPLYQATTRLFVLAYEPNNTNSLDYDVVLASQALLSNYQELIKSQVITTKVIKTLNLQGVTSSQLVKQINIEIIPNTSMINVTVRNENRDIVDQIAIELCNEFISQLNALTKTNNVSMVDRVTVSQTPVYPRTKLFIAFGFLMGLMLSLVLVILLVSFDDTIGNLEEIEKKTGLKVIGILPDTDKVRGKL